MGKFTVFKEGGFAVLHELQINGVTYIQKTLKDEVLISQFKRLEREYRTIAEN